MSGNKIQFRLAAYTDPAGKWNEDAPKKGNEDDLFVDADLCDEIQGQFIADEVIGLGESGCLMAVADGMGGMNAGEVASAIAIQTVKSAFGKNNLTDDILSSAGSRTKYLEKVVAEADAAIKKKSRDDKECEGMGSTLIMAWLYDNELTVTWCGDSRAYLFRNTDGISQISKDHSYVQGLVDAGSITELEAFNHPYGNIITRSLGDPEKKAKPDSITIPVCKGDIIMLCSDGLSGVLRDRKSLDSEGNIIPGDNLEDIISTNRTSMTECREALWSAAENAGWYDNVTVILCEIVEGRENKTLRNSRGDADANLSKGSMNKSFISIRFHKKSLGAIGFSVAAILISAAVYFAGKEYIHANLQKDFSIQVDSLRKESELLGIKYISASLNKFDTAKIDIGTLGCIKKEFDKRKMVLSELDSLLKKVDSLGLSGSVAVISALKDSIRISEIPEYDIQKLKTSIDFADSLLNNIRNFMTQNKTSLSKVQSKQIENFMVSIVEKEYIGEDELKNWNKLSTELIKDIQSNVSTESSELQQENKYEGKEPSLTPVTDE